jgi:hypothetical protein
MDIIADLLLGAGAMGAGLFCYVLSRKLRSFSTLETGMGGAIAVLSAQVDDMTRALEQARAAAGDSTLTLRTLTERAEASAQRLELLLASLHDMPESGQTKSLRRLKVMHRPNRTRDATDDEPDFSSRRHGEVAA